MVKKQQDCLVCQIWKPLMQDIALLKIVKNFGNSQKFAKFLKLGIALIYTTC